MPLGGQHDRLEKILQPELLALREVAGAGRGPGDALARAREFDLSLILPLYEDFYKEVLDKSMVKD